MSCSSSSSMSNSSRNRWSQQDGGRGARVSACAGLTNKLLSCWVDPRIAWWNTDTAIVGDWWTGVRGHHALVGHQLVQKVPLGCLISFQLPMGFQNFVVINTIRHLKKRTDSDYRVRTNLVDYTEPSHKTSIKKFWLEQSLATEYTFRSRSCMKVRFNSWPPHRRTIRNDWENKCKIATKEHRGLHKFTFHQPQKTNYPRDAGNNTTHMIFENELLLLLSKEVGNAMLGESD